MKKFSFFTNLCIKKKRKEKKKTAGLAKFLSSAGATYHSNRRWLVTSQFFPPQKFFIFSALLLELFWGANPNCFDRFNPGFSRAVGIHSPVQISPKRKILLFQFDVWSLCRKNFCNDYEQDLSKNNDSFLFLAVVTDFELINY